MITCITGNPPYSNKSKNLFNLDEYKYCKVDDNGIRKRIENGLSLHNIQDDYVKFIRWAQEEIDKKPYGIIAVITNNGFINNVTFQGMRWSLLNSFDEIYILDLHGNSRKKEKCPDGSKDENVFNIMAGVCISIFIKTKPKDKLKNIPDCKVYHHDVYGDKKYKYDFLNRNDIYTIKWNEVKPEYPYYLFIPQDNILRKEYDTGYPINKMFSIFSSGIKTGKDEIVIHKSKESLQAMLFDFINLDEDTIRIKYKVEDTTYWKLSDAIKIVKKYQNNLEECIHKIYYRPFDTRWFFNKYSCGKEKIIANSKISFNINLITSKGLQTLNSNYSVVTKEVACARSFTNPGHHGTDHSFSLYKKNDTLKGL